MTTLSGNLEKPVESAYPSSTNSPCTPAQTRAVKPVEFDQFVAELRLVGVF